MTLWLRYSNTLQEADLRRDGGNFLSDEGLETAVVISLFTDRQAESTDEIPDGTDDRRGWWGDAFADEEGDRIGSRLWLLRDAKGTQQALNDAKLYAEEALRWMLDDGVAKSVTVTTFVLPGDGDIRLAINVEIERPGDAAPRWQGRWEVPFAI